MYSPHLKKIVLITDKQPSSNPRLVKEAVALNEAGYEVTVIYNFWSLWAEDADKNIFKNSHHIKWVRVGGHPANDKFSYWLSRLRHKFFKLLAAKFTKNLQLQVLAAAQFYPELSTAACKEIAGLYIAHNLAALPAAAKAAKKKHARYAFDAEDFHRGQETGNAKETNSITLIENNYFPGTAFITAASPLIAAEYSKYYPNKNFTVINNVFSRDQQAPFRFIDSTPLKLFWFSQTVGLKRGVQDVIAAMNKISTFPIQLTILGDASDTVKALLNSSLTNSKHQLIFIPPCGEEELLKQASVHHIGLALEPGFSINNNIALSNKLFTYLLAGNAVILSSTPAQELFYRQYPQTGWCYSPGDIEELIHIIEQAYYDEILLTEKRQQAWKLASTTLNWENEQQQFLDLVKTAV